MPKVTLQIEFDSEEEARAYLSGATRAAPTPEPTPTPTPEPTPTAETRTDEVTDDVDADGMPYDPDLHATPKSFTAAGKWRAARGKSKEADAARAEFKAAGGSVEPPAEPATSVGMPGMPTASVKAPVTYEALVDKTMALMDRGIIKVEGIQELYSKHNLTDPSVLETNESMRAALMADLVAMEEAA